MRVVCYVVSGVCVLDDVSTFQRCVQIYDHEFNQHKKDQKKKKNFSSSA